MAKKNTDAIGMKPDGEIEQYAPGESIPPTTYRVIDEDGNVTEESLTDDESLFENDDDLDLDDDDEEDDA